MTSRWWVMMALLAWALGGSAAYAANDGCMDGAKTDLEKLYCQVVREGQGAGLPSATDFRRNDPQVQRLLLRRPAGRLGLKVPAAGAETPPAPPGPKPTQARPEPAPAAPAQTAPSTDGRLADCRLAGERLVCGQQQYELASNQPNSQLADGVLAADNRLGLAPFKGDRGDEEAVRRYLSDAYDRYIPKMLDIGLGANTMSFTAFHNAFHTLEASGVDFAARMEQTFALLKRDKKTLGVKARYHNELPRDVSLCTVINADVIVCDNVGTNWVFVQAGR